MHFSAFIRYTVVDYESSLESYVYNYSKLSLVRSL